MDTSAIEDGGLDGLRRGPDSGTLDGGLPDQSNTGMRDGGLNGRLPRQPEPYTRDGEPTRHPGSAIQPHGAVQILALPWPVRRWFERREVVIGIAVLLAVGIFVLRTVTSNSVETIGLLYVIPVALVGLELGLRWGLAAAATGVLMMIVRPPSSDAAVSAIGLASRAVALIAVGAIAGRFSERMRDAQARLDDHFRSADHLLGVHEHERHKIAEQLHEQAAQAMAAALLLVGRLEGEPTSQPLARKQLEEVRESVRECISHLRHLAATLRSPVLSELGLVPALERIFESRSQGQLVISLDSDGLPSRLPPAAEVLAYRVIEGVVGCLAGTVTVHVGLDAPDVLRIWIAGQPSALSSPQEIEAALATTRARLEIVGGAMSHSRRHGLVEVAAELPVRLTVPAADQSPM